MGDASAIHASAPREQRTDKRDARQILRLPVENRFPAVWRPLVANQEQRQLLFIAAGWYGWSADQEPVGCDR